MRKRETDFNRGGRQERREKIGQEIRKSKYEVVGIRGAGYQEIRKLNIEHRTRSYEC